MHTSGGRDIRRARLVSIEHLRLPDGVLTGTNVGIDAAAPRRWDSRLFQFLRRALGTHRSSPNPKSNCPLPASG